MTARSGLYPRWGFDRVMCVPVLGTHFIMYTSYGDDA